MDPNNPTNPDPAQQPQPAAPVQQDLPGDDFAFESAFSNDFSQQPEEPSSQADPTQQIEPGQEPQPNPYLEQARSLGFDFGDDASQEEIFQTITDHYARIQPLAQYGQSLMPHAQQIADLLAQQQQAQQPQQPEEPEWTPENYFKERWNAPEWKSQYDTVIQNGMVERNPRTGLFQAASGYESMVAPILPGLNEAHQFQAQKWQSLMRSNPYEHFYQNLQEPLQRAWKQDIAAEVQRHFGRQQHMSSVQQFEQQNASWMYQQNQRGEYVPTEAGSKFLNNVRMLRDGGMRDPNLIIQSAQMMLGQPPQQQQAPEAPEGDQHPTIPFPQQPAQQTPQKTFLQNALNKAGHNPQSGASSADSPDVPAKMSQGDLENAFINAHRASSARTG